MNIEPDVMKAIVVREYGDENVLKIEEVETPSVDSGQILVEIKAAGINPVDTYIRQGNHPTAPPVPFTPGKDAAGVVVVTGEDVTKVVFAARDSVLGYCGDVFELTIRESPSLSVEPSSSTSARKITRTVL